MGLDRRYFDQNFGAHLTHKVCYANFRDKSMSVLGIFYVGAVFPNLFLRVEFLLKFLGIIVNQSNLTRIKGKF